ncbi:MAG: ATP-binding cassette domain-containing protein [Acidobacteriota bacterium]
MDTAIQLTNVSKSFGRFRAVDDLSLKIPSGSMFGLLGPNGAGKTTTIRMIMNITAPDSGRIEVLGRQMDRPMQNRIGYLPEERGLYRRMKVIDHLYFLAAIKEVNRETAKKRIDGWLDKMELRPWLNKKVEALSKGMQQKVQFIATIVHDPDILILDEPFSGLDPINTALLKDYFLEFREKGKTIIFSTHVLEQAERLCDEICLLARSKKVLEGTLKDLKHRFSENQIRISADTDLGTLAGLPGVLAARPMNGEFILTLDQSVDQRAFLKNAIERFRVDSFSQKEPELEEIYLTTVRDAGLEDTRTIE